MPSAASPPPPPGPAELYERLLVGSLFAPWATLLLDRVAPAPGARVLDVACGTGIVARLALGRVGAGGRVVGVDRSPGMLAVARAVEPAIDWRQGDAAALPLDRDERFDAVLCHQGVQFFDDRPAAVGAMRRALAPGGRLGVAVWRGSEENGLFHDLGRAARRLLGPVADPRHAFGDADALTALLTRAGFVDVRVEPTSMETRLELEASALAELNASAVVEMTAAGRSASESERARLVAAVVEASLPEIARHADGGAIAFRTSANVATART